MTSGYVKLAERTARIGVVTLWRRERDGQHFASIRNRTYRSSHPIPLERVPAWRELLAR